MYVETSVNNMANVKASFESIDIPYLNTDNNVGSDMIFMSDCTQLLGSRDPLSCSGVPTYATSGVSSLSLTGVGSDFISHEQGGFSTNGRIVSGSLAVCRDSATPCTPVSADESVYAVTEITCDAWNLNTIMAGGDWSLASNSTFIEAKKDTSAN